MKKMSKRTNGSLATLFVSILGVYIALLVAFGYSDEPFEQPERLEKSSKKTEKGHKKDQPGMFLKLHNYLQTEVGKDRPDYTAGYQLREFSKAQSQFRNQRFGRARVASPALEWEERGPGNVSGRTPGIWVDLSDNTLNTWLTGSSGGGIWKTTDGGDSWASKTDNLPNQTISGVMGSKADVNIVYAGTGKRFSNSSVPGNGILKSIDKGETWEVLPTTLDDPRFVNISRIAVDQANANNIVASTFTDSEIPSSDSPFESYVFKSTDAGANWVEMLNSSSMIQQIISSDTNFDLQFISLNGESIQRTTNGGTTWETVFSSSSVDLNGFSLDRMEVAIAPGNDNHIFIAAYVVNQQQNTDGSLLIFSSDQGDTWSIVTGKDNANNFGNWLRSQGWYDNTIAVHPYDDMSVYVAGVSAILKLTVEDKNGDNYNGSREVLSDGYGAYQDANVSSKGVHVDHHHLLLVPVDEATKSFHLLNGNDGGIAISKDGGTTFKQTGDTFKEEGGIIYDTFLGYNTVEFYGVDKKNGGDRYIAGSQDNGSWLSGTNPGTTSVWASAPSGDGFQAAWHYENTDLILESSQFNGIYRSGNEGATWNAVSLPVQGGPFLTEIENSKQDPDLVFVVSPQGLMRSLDFALTWEVINMPSSWSYNRFTTPVAISLAAPDVVWSGTGVSSNNRVAVSRDGGASWTETSEYTEAARGGVTNITSHPSEEGTAYVLFSQANGPKVLKSADYGVTWNDITGFDGNVASSSSGFPNVPAYSMVVMPYNNDIIWVGTAIGIVESQDGGTTWALKTDHNLPAVAVWDMRIVNDEVIIATHGRGIWSAALPELDGYEPVDVVLAPQLTASSDFYGSILKGSTNLRSAYDNTKIILRGSFGEVTVDEIGANTAGQVVEWQYDLKDQIDGTSDIDVTIVIESTAGMKMLTRTKETTVFNILEASKTYLDELDSDVESRVLLDGITSSSALAKSGNALHTEHPYQPNTVYQFLLRTPLELSADTAILNYSDIALVEPGDNDTNRIWDFVAIEGLKLNGDATNDWVTIDRYDARRFTEWQGAFSSGANPTADMFKDERLDLYNGPLNSFAKGDVILLRFSLYTDPEVNGYGWIVDDITFNYKEEEVPLAAGNELPDNTLMVYPNPVDAVANFNYQVYNTGQIKISMYNLNGAEVKVIVAGEKQKGEYQLKYDASQLQAGTYFVKMETPKGSAFQKVFVR